MRQPPHAQVVDDEERHGREPGDDVLPRAVERGVGEFLQQYVGLPRANAVALEDSGAANRLGEVALAGAGRTEKPHILALLDETPGRQVVDQRPGGAAGRRSRYQRRKR
jgi:hypothetical protein